ncbi:hypothetical protein [Dyella jiangningensis]|uniref:Cobalamin ABC transporter n=1 Tax=Dyella jiangningensis TaxID=1379159 RepID=A0A328P068_9GAMM|nr:hypothetical protein [Dyella jiangningensis]RAO75658.1 hypothetical protein CA260_16540 [Dyella jiangningensis]
MKMPTGPRFAALAGLLALVMVATRFKHFGDMLHLPDASMAVFFLGGVYLRRHGAFVAMLLLTVALDWVSITYAGVGDFCVTAAYAFLPLAYGVLWYAGRWYAPRLNGQVRSLAGAFGVALLAAVASFAVSNGSFYWLGGRYPDPNVAQYVSRLWQWGPLFVRTTMSYIAVALVVHAVCARLAADSHATRHQEA